ncbi:MAG: hypothetical protein NZ740_04095 [Kiritimatiellae bacterium]|nr:hypothetical protein [Kiritimatiellia bacterium]MDW8458270.1 hypothetical protein [Verrucomicrobiota bacterium]
MMRFGLVVVAAWCALVALSHAAQPASVMAAGDVDPALVERARRWAEENLAIPVPYAGSLDISSPTASLHEVAELAARKLPEDAVGAVVLYRGEPDSTNHGIYRPDLRVVVVNVRELLKDNPDEERIGRRLERQVIRGICSLMGMEYSPNPESAMTYYSTLEELDEIGRNLDPPWLLELQEKARDMGIPLDPDNPYNMFREFSEE